MISYRPDYQHITKHTPARVLYASWTLMTMSTIKDPLFIDRRGHKLTQRDCPACRYLLFAGGESLLCKSFPLSARTAVICVRIDWNSSARRKNACNFDIFRIHKPDEVLHYLIDTILVKIPVVAEAEKIKLKAFAFNHPDIRHIAYPYLREVRLSGNRA